MLCDPMDCSPPGSSVDGISQARILEWVAMSSSRVSSRPRDWTCVSCIASGFFTTEPPGKHRFLYLFIICLSHWNINSRECRGYCFAHCYSSCLEQSSVQQVLKNICCSNAFCVDWPYYFDNIIYYWPVFECFLIKALKGSNLMDSEVETLN